MNIMATIKEIRDYNDPYVYDKEFSSYGKMIDYINDKNTDINANFIITNIVQS